MTGNVELERDVDFALTLGQIHLHFVDEFPDKRSKLLWTDKDGNMHVSECRADHQPCVKNTPVVSLGSTLQVVSCNRKGIADALSA